jgi:hypothetical protein
MPDPPRRKLRIEVCDEAGTTTDGTYTSDTIALVEINLPDGMEIPGGRLIEGARLAYQHATGADLPPLVIQADEPLSSEQTSMIRSAVRDMFVDEFCRATRKEGGRV